MVLKIKPFTMRYVQSVCMYMSIAVDQSETGLHLHCSDTVIDKTVRNKQTVTQPMTKE